jgi:hypothetical protein
MIAPKDRSKQNREERNAATSATVKGMAVEERAIQDAKTGKLRKLREARDAADGLPEKKKPEKKGKR